MNSPTQDPVVSLPRSALSTLFRRCVERGDAGIEVLREAGDRAGGGLLATLAEAPAALPASEFWSRFDAAVRRAGLGSVSYLPVSQRSGAIAWRDSVEAPEEPPGGACCHFAAALLGGVLRRAANRPVAVKEVRCGGGQPCWFMFGSAETIREVPAGVDVGGGGR
ncbi:hypothetical protein [Candidatus Palauibacter sp.]|uniref:hypothetical protein n=1 Tax=Candidatus Palauibacter sp. TaxID=3101350 RepID=UPI003B027162